MSVEENKETIRRVEEAWDSNDLGALDQYFAPDFDNSASSVPGIPVGLEGAKTAHRMAMQSFPDRKVTIEDMVAESDRVMVRTRVVGTNKGGVPWMGAPANGNPIDIQSVSIYRFADGKIAQHWGLNDAFLLAMQLGTIPAPGP